MKSKINQKDRYSMTSYIREIQIIALIEGESSMFTCWGTNLSLQRGLGEID